MTGEEAKKAFMNRSPVIYNGAEYTHIKEIIYSINRQNEVVVSVVLADKNGISYIRAKIKDVKEKTL